MVHWDFLNKTPHREAHKQLRFIYLFAILKIENPWKIYMLDFWKGLILSFISGHIFYMSSHGVSFSFTWPKEEKTVE